MLPLIQYGLTDVICLIHFNSLLIFNDLQDFYVRMAIVADIKRKPEFEAKMRFHAFDDLRLNKRVSFLSYDALVKQYEMEQEKQSFEFIL